MRSIERREFVVAGDEAGMRLDVLLPRHVPDWSRSQVQRLIRLGNVSVAGRAATRAAEKVEAGSLISVRAGSEGIFAATGARPEPILLKIIYKDDDLAVVDKPAGMAVHVGAGIRSGTLANALRHHLGGGLSDLGGDERPGIVHRLDKMTSGLIVVARNNVAHRALASQFSARTVRKQYRALVHGRVEKDSGEITGAVGRDPIRRVRMRVGGIAPREASTSYRSLRRFSRFTEIEAEPHTGRTHQIRVHMASLRHPIAGDKLYGAPGVVRIAGREAPTLSRNFLHAERICFSHPRTGEQLSFFSPLPVELQEFLDQIISTDV